MTDIHHRRSMRLKGYDYSQAGAYFITICTQNREMLLGKITVGADPSVCPQMIFNDAGKMAEKWYLKLSDKFSDIENDLYIVMPNHFHCIIQKIATTNSIVGADPCVCPDNQFNKHAEQGEHTGSPLRRVIQWFKTMTTNEYINNAKQNDWRSFSGKLWQRNYYEHVIRSESDLNKIREYIVNNPLHWTTDENYIN